MFKILEECTASVRKSVEGLDYYVVEGGKAFQDLESVVDKLAISATESKELKKSLLEVKQYIKADYKVIFHFVLSNFRGLFSLSPGSDIRPYCQSKISSFFSQFPPRKSQSEGKKKSHQGANAINK